MAKKIFIAATRQNDGKTSVSLGLIYSFKKKFEKIGFIKPVGQRYLIEQGEMVDEDSILVENVCQMNNSLKEMSPIAVERGFTEKYIQHPERESLVEQIKKSFSQIEKKNDLVVIEGTGHAGVGSVFDLSNAGVAKLLEAKVILISSGGIGRPIDELMLNKALFEKEGVDILGVVVNKVLPEKYKKVDALIRKSLGNKGLNVLGVIPYETLLSIPTVGQVQDELKAQVLHGSGFSEHPIEKIIVAAMEPRDAISYIKDKSLVITPGDRDDIILTAISMHLIHADNGPSIAGLLLTGGIKPHHSVVELLKNTDIPVLLVPGDTYSVASQVHDLTVKIRPQDKTKTNMVIDLVNKYVDIETIMNNI